jgi:serine/threonine protein phosphatase 1
MNLNQIMRTLAIGDIHGCHTALTKLLHLVAPTSADRVVFLGDYIDRGPQSRAVLECLLDQPNRSPCVFLRGNHEVMILQARQETLQSHLWQSYGGLETLHSYGADYRQDWPAAIPDSHWAFLEATIPCFETPTHIFVHASLDPDADIGSQPDWLLYWEFLDRLQPHKSGKKIICGHTPQRSGLVKDLGFATCIDTGPANGGWLTCLDVETGTFWQANQSGESRTRPLPSASH